MSTSPQPQNRVAAAKVRAAGEPDFIITGVVRSGTTCRHHPALWPPTPASTPRAAQAIDDAFAATVAQRHLAVYDRIRVEAS